MEEERVLLRTKTTNLQREGIPWQRFMEDLVVQAARTSAMLDHSHKSSWIDGSRNVGRGSLLKSDLTLRERKIYPEHGTVPFSRWHRSPPSLNVRITTGDRIQSLVRRPRSGRVVPFGLGFIHLVEIMPTFSRLIVRLNIIRPFLLEHHTKVMCHNSQLNTCGPHYL